MINFNRRCIFFLSQIFIVPVAGVCLIMGKPYVSKLHNNIPFVLHFCCGIIINSFTIKDLCKWQFFCKFTIMDALSFKSQQIVFIFSDILILSSTKVMVSLNIYSDIFSKYAIAVNNFLILLTINFRVNRKSLRSTSWLISQLKTAEW